MNLSGSLTMLALVITSAPFAASSRATPLRFGFGRRALLLAPLAIAIPAEAANPVREGMVAFAAGVSGGRQQRPHALRCDL